MSSIRPKAANVTQTVHPKTGDVWQVAPDPQPPAIIRLQEPLPTFTQIKARQYIYFNQFSILPVVYGTKEPFLQTPARMGRLPYTPAFPFQYHELDEVFAAYVNIGVAVGRPSGIPLNTKRRALTVIDCDTHKAANRLKRQLIKLDIPYYATVTARGMHFYFYTRREVGNFTNKHFGIEIKGNNLQVIAPPSVLINGQGEIIHRYTHEGADIPPFIELQDLIDLFEYEDGSKITEFVFITSDRKSTHNGLTNRTNETIRNGHLYPDGKRRYINIAAWEMHNKKYSPDAIRSALTLAASNCKKGYLDSVIASVTKNPPQLQNNSLPRLNMLDRVNAYIDQHPDQFSGRKGLNAKQVLRALAERYMKDNRDGVFRASYRELLLLTIGIGSLVTIARAIEYLKGLGVIEYVDKAVWSKANRYRFGDVCNKCTLGYAYTSDESNVHILHSLKSDAAHSKAFGVVGMEIWGKMLGIAQTHPISFNRLVTLAGVPPRTLRYHLSPNRWLRRSGAVKKVKGGYVAEYFDAAMLDERVSRPAGTLGKSAAQKARIVLERGHFEAAAFIKSRFNYKYTEKNIKLLEAFKDALTEYTEYRKLADYPTPTRRNRKPKTEQAQPVECSPMVNTPISTIVETPTDQRGDLPTSNPFSADVAHKIDSSPIAPPTPEAAPATLPTFDGFMNVTARELARLKAIEQAQGNVATVSARPVDVSTIVDNLGTMVPIPAPSIADLEKALIMRRGALMQSRYYIDKAQVQQVIKTHQKWIGAGNVTAIQQYLADTEQFKGKARK